MTAPCSGVPLPGGSPVPSGGMLISHPATSAGVAGRPRLGVSWATLQVYPATVMLTSTMAVKLCVDIFHLAVCFHLPCLDGMIVVGDIRAVCGHQGIACWLDCTRVVGGAAFQYR